MTGGTRSLPSSSTSMNYSPHGPSRFVGHPRPRGAGSRLLRRPTAASPWVLAPRGRDAVHRVHPLDRVAADAQLPRQRPGDRFAFDDALLEVLPVEQVPHVDPCRAPGVVRRPDRPARRASVLRSDRDGAGTVVLVQLRGPATVCEVRAQQLAPVAVVNVPSRCNAARRALASSARISATT